MKDLRILLVDDNELVRKFVYDLLKTIYPGCKIVEGEDGEEIIRNVDEARRKDEKFDLYFTDNNMPNLDGLEALIQLRNAGNLTPAVIYTANLEEIAPHIKQLKSVYGAKKPCEINELKNVIDAALASSQDIT